MGDATSPSWWGHRCPPGPSQNTMVKVFPDFQCSTALGSLHLILQSPLLWSRLDHDFTLFIYRIFLFLFAVSVSWGSISRTRMSRADRMDGTIERESARERERSLQDADCDKGLVGHKNPILPGESSSHQWIFYSLSDCVARKDFFKASNSIFALLIGYIFHSVFYFLFRLMIYFTMCEMWVTS